MTNTDRPEISDIHVAGTPLNSDAVRPSALDGEACAKAADDLEEMARRMEEKTRDADLEDAMGGMMRDAFGEEDVYGRPAASEAGSASVSGREAALESETGTGNVETHDADNATGADDAMEADDGPFEDGSAEDAAFAPADAFDAADEETGSLEDEDPFEGWKMEDGADPASGEDASAASAASAGTPEPSPYGDDMMLGESDETGSTVGTPEPSPYGEDDAMFGGEGDTFEEDGEEAAESAEGFAASEDEPLPDFGDEEAQAGSRDVFPVEREEYPETGDGGDGEFDWLALDDTGAADEAESVNRPVSPFEGVVNALDRMDDRGTDTAAPDPVSVTPAEPAESNAFAEDDAPAGSDAFAADSASDEGDVSAFDLPDEDEGDGVTGSAGRDPLGKAGYNLDKPSGSPREEEGEATVSTADDVWADLETTEDLEGGAVASDSEVEASGSGSVDDAGTAPRRGVFGRMFGKKAAPVPAPEATSSPASEAAPEAVTEGSAPSGDSDPIRIPTVEAGSESDETEVRDDNIWAGLASDDNGSDTDEADVSAPSAPPVKKRRGRFLATAAIVALAIPAAGFVLYDEYGDTLREAVSGSRDRVTATVASEEVGGETVTPAIRDGSPVPSGAAPGDDDGLSIYETAQADPVGNESAMELLAQSGQSGQDNGSSGGLLDSLDAVANEELGVPDAQESDRMAAMEAAITGLDDTLQELQSEVGAIGSTVSDLETRLSRTQTRVGDLDALVQDQVQAASSVGRLEEALQQTQTVILDMSERMSEIEDRQPPSREVVNRALSEVESQIAKIRNSISILANRATSPAASRDVSGNAPAGATYDTPAGRNAFDISSRDGAVPSDVGIDDFVDGYGYVTDIVRTQSGGRLVVMENGSVLLP